LADTDGDGIPDAYEMTYSGSNTAFEPESGRQTGTGE